MPGSTSISPHGIYDSGDRVLLLSEGYNTSGSTSSTTWDYVSGATNNIAMDFDAIPTDRFQEIQLRVGGYIENDSGALTEFTVMDHRGGQDNVVEAAAVSTTESGFSPWDWGPFTQFNPGGTSDFYGQIRVDDSNSVGEITAGAVELWGVVK